MVLSIVSPPKGATTSSAVDIVAVHGLGGDFIETWTHPKSNAFWLKDFLPQQIPDARIMTFGYNAAAAFGQSTSDVIDHAKGLLNSLVDKREESEEKDCPLIFIAHSLGGIVVKQALLQARLEPRYQSIRDATLGIIFLGTPHRGSEKATYGKVLVNVAQTLINRPSSRLLTALETNSVALLRLTSDFRFQLHQYHIVSFYEQRPMKIFSGPIVEKFSALLAAEHEEHIPIDSNHGAMCKFETESDVTFAKICKRIQRMRTDPRPRATNQPTYYEVPYPVSPFFIGQEEVCRCLDASLAPAKLPHQPIQQRVVLFGLGGSGKTQICLKYVETHRERYWGIFWIHASTRDSIQDSMAQIALLLQVDKDIDSVKQMLATTSQPWLLVFDDADNPNLSLAPYFPAGDRGDIIITSRNPECRQYSTVGSWEVGQMSYEDSEALLLRIAYGNTALDEEVQKESRKVVETLGRLALAVTQAGTYIRRESCSLEEFLERYQRRRNELGHFPKHTGTDYRYTEQFHVRPLELVDERLTFVDSAYGTASHGQSSRIMVHVPAEKDLVAEEVDDSRTEYSDLSTAESKMDTYVECLADDLFAVAFTLQSDLQRIRTLCKVLPELLQQFALRIGHEAPSKEGREAMFYVHRHRRRVAELFEQRCTNGNEDQEDSASAFSDTIPFQEKVTNWFTQEDTDIELPEDATYELPDEPESHVEKYTKFVSKTSAYNWLLANIGRELTQISQDDDLLKTIRHRIWRCLPPLPKISIRRQPDSLSLIFKVNWNPIAFILEQNYSEDPAVALERAITLTGLPTDAQALPCFQYLNQAWPSSGSCVARLLQKLTHAEISQQVQGDSSDCSKLTAWRSSSAVYVEVSGTRCSITEIGEQLAWLGAALRSSPYDGIANCRPYIDDSLWTTEEQLELKHSLDQDGLKALKIDFSFDQNGLDTDENSQGRCWHNLFRNPVLARGFPILRRSPHHNGLELPLNMMAGLVKAVRAHVFNNVVVIKGFSTMLVPSGQADGLLVWHVFFNADGSRISYLGHNLPQLQGVSLSYLQTARHIVGWCSRAKSHAGGLEASYNIERSRLPSPGAGCVLEKVSINGGKFVTAGFNFGIGIKDVPVHVSRKPYVQKLRWVSSKFFVFWDEEKRGWLVKGISALLHLVRASLKHYETDPFKEALLSKSANILEPSAESQEDYSISILLDESNMKLPIYAEKDEVEPYAEDLVRQGPPRATKRKKRYYRLEDRVEELYEILEKLIEYQIDVTGQAGVRMKAHVRRRLEGWDFKDLASDRDPFYPRVATLHALGKGWVDFIRSIQAVTLFGTGFGQIIRSSDNIACPNWTEVPKGKFYLAACVPDLRQIMELDGDHTANPMKICNGISWFSPSAAFDVCRCAKTHGGVHSDFVQTLWPTSLRSVLPKREKLPLQDEGAVIFGHNVTFKWKWEDNGDPIMGDPSLESTETEEEFYDSGIGITETSGSGQVGQGPPNNGNYEMTSLQRLQTSGPHVRAPEPASARPVNLQNTTSSNAVDQVNTAENAARPSKRFFLVDGMKRRLRTSWRTKDG